MMYCTKDTLLPSAASAKIPDDLAISCVCSPALLSAGDHHISSLDVTSVAGELDLDFDHDFGYDPFLFCEETSFSTSQGLDGAVSSEAVEHEWQVEVHDAKEGNHGLLEEFPPQDATDSKEGNHGHLLEFLFQNSKEETCNLTGLMDQQGLPPDPLFEGSSKLDLPATCQSQTPSNEYEICDHNKAVSITVHVEQTASKQSTMVPLQVMIPEHLTNEHLIQDGSELSQLSKSQSSSSLFPELDEDIFLECCNSDKSRDDHIQKHNSGLLTDQQNCFEALRSDSLTGRAAVEYKTCRLEEPNDAEHCGSLPSPFDVLKQSSMLMDARYGQQDNTGFVCTNMQFDLNKCYSSTQSAQYGQDYKSSAKPFCIMEQPEDCAGMNTVCEEVGESASLGRLECGWDLLSGHKVTAETDSADHLLMSAAGQASLPSNSSITKDPSSSVLMNHHNASCDVMGQCATFHNSGLIHRPDSGEFSSCLHEHVSVQYENIPRAVKIVDHREKNAGQSQILDMDTSLVIPSEHGEVQPIQRDMFNMELFCSYSDSSVTKTQMSTKKTVQLSEDPTQTVFDNETCAEDNIESNEGSCVLSEHKEKATSSKSRRNRKSNKHENVSTKDEASVKRKRSMTMTPIPFPPKPDVFSQAMADSLTSVQNWCLPASGRFSCSGGDAKAGKEFPRKKTYRSGRTVKQLLKDAGIHIETESSEVEPKLPVGRRAQKRRSNGSNLLCLENKTAQGEDNNSGVREKAQCEDSNSMGGEKAQCEDNSWDGEKQKTQNLNHQWEDHTFKDSSMKRVCIRGKESVEKMCVAQNGIPSHQSSCMQNCHSFRKPDSDNGESQGESLIAKEMGQTFSQASARSTDDTHSNLEGCSHSSDYQGSKQSRQSFHEQSADAFRHDHEDSKQMTENVETGSQLRRDGICNHTEQGSDQSTENIPHDHTDVVENCSPVCQHSLEASHLCENCYLADLETADQRARNAQSREDIFMQRVAKVEINVKTNSADNRLRGIHHCRQTENSIAREVCSDENCMDVQSDNMGTNIETAGSKRQKELSLKDSEEDASISIVETENDQIIRDRQNYDKPVTLNVEEIQNSMCQNCGEVQIDKKKFGEESNSERLAEAHSAVQQNVLLMGQERQREGVKRHEIITVKADQDSVVQSCDEQESSGLQNAEQNDGEYLSGPIAVANDEPDGSEQTGTLCQMQTCSGETKGTETDTDKLTETDVNGEPEDSKLCQMQTCSGETKSVETDTDKQTDHEHVRCQGIVDRTKSNHLNTVEQPLEVQSKHSEFTSCRENELDPARSVAACHKNQECPADTKTQSDCLNSSYDRLAVSSCSPAKNVCYEKDANTEWTVDTSGQDTDVPVVEKVHKIVNICAQSSDIETQKQDTVLLNFHHSPPSASACPLPMPEKSICIVQDGPSQDGVAKGAMTEVEQTLEDNIDQTVCVDTIEPDNTFTNSDCQVNMQSSQTSSFEKLTGMENNYNESDLVDDCFVECFSVTSTGTLEVSHSSAENSEPGLNATASVFTDIECTHDGITLPDLLIYSAELAQTQRDKSMNMIGGERTSVSQLLSLDGRNIEETHQPDFSRHTDYTDLAAVFSQMSPDPRNHNSFESQNDMTKLMQGLPGLINTDQNLSGVKPCHFKSIVPENDAENAHFPLERGDVCTGTQVFNADSITAPQSPRYLSDNCESYCHLGKTNDAQHSSPHKEGVDRDELEVDSLSGNGGESLTHQQMDPLEVWMDNETNASEMSIFQQTIKSTNDRDLALGEKGKPAGMYPEVGFSAGSRHDELPDLLTVFPSVNEMIQEYIPSFSVPVCEMDRSLPSDRDDCTSLPPCHNTTLGCNLDDKLKYFLPSRHRGCVSKPSDNSWLALPEVTSNILFDADHHFPPLNTTDNVLALPREVTFPNQAASKATQKYPPGSQGTFSMSSKQVGVSGRLALGSLISNYSVSDPKVLHDFTHSHCLSTVPSEKQQSVVSSKYSALDRCGNNQQQQESCDSNFSSFDSDMLNDLAALLSDTSMTSELSSVNALSQTQRLPMPPCEVASDLSQISRNRSVYDTLFENTKHVYCDRMIDVDAQISSSLSKEVPFTAMPNVATSPAHQLALTSVVDQDAVIPSQHVQGFSSSYLHNHAQDLLCSGMMLPLLTSSAAVGRNPVEFASQESTTCSVSLHDVNGVLLNANIPGIAVKMTPFAEESTASDNFFNPTTLSSMVTSPRNIQISLASLSAQSCSSSQTSGPEVQRDNAQAAWNFSGNDGSKLDVCTPGNIQLSTTAEATFSIDSLPRFQGSSSAACSTNCGALFSMRQPSVSDQIVKNVQPSSDCALASTTATECVQQYDMSMASSFFSQTPVRSTYSRQVLPVRSSTESQSQSHRIPVSFSCSSSSDHCVSLLQSSSAAEAVMATSTHLAENPEDVTDRSEHESPALNTREPQCEHRTLSSVRPNKGVPAVADVQQHPFSNPFYVGEGMYEYRPTPGDIHSAKMLKMQCQNDGGGANSRCHAGKLSFLVHSICIGDFTLTVDDEKYSKNSRVCFIFMERKMCYEMVLTQPIKTPAFQGRVISMEIKFSSIVGLWGADNKLLVEVNEAPATRMTGMRATLKRETIDISGGQIQKTPYHFLIFQQTSVASIKRHLCSDPLLCDLLVHPVTVDLNKTLPFTDAPVMSPRERGIGCKCNTACKQKRCKCLRQNYMCTRNCVCQNCQNPFNQLQGLKLSMEDVRSDPCLLDRLPLMQDVSKFLATEVELPCCGEQATFLHCVPGQRQCSKCSASFRLSWCFERVFLDSSSHCGHCLKCKKCFKDFESHSHNQVRRDGTGKQAGMKKRGRPKRVAATVTGSG